MIAFRLVRAEHARTLNGEGARRWGSRWNSPGTALLFCADSRALALCEVLAHLTPQGRFTDDYVMVELEFPDEEVRATPSLPTAWRRQPYGPASRIIGDAFVDRGDQLAMRLPSAVVERDWNFVINPAHARASSVEIVSVDPFTWDPRYFQAL